MFLSELCIKRPVLAIMLSAFDQSAVDQVIAKTQYYLNYADYFIGSYWVLRT